MTNARDRVGRPTFELAGTSRPRLSSRDQRRIESDVSALESDVATLMEQSGGSSPNYAQLHGTTTPTINNIERDIAWGSDIDSGSGWLTIGGLNNEELTFTSAGLYRIDPEARGTHNNRSELLIRVYLSVLGGAFTQILRYIQSNYASRDGDQNTGGVGLKRLIQIPNDGDKIKISIESDADNAASLMEEGTNIIITGPLATAE